MQLRIDNETWLDNVFDVYLNNDVQVQGNLLLTRLINIKYRRIVQDSSIKQCKKAFSHLFNNFHVILWVKYTYISS